MKRSLLVALITAAALAVAACTSNDPDPDVITVAPDETFDTKAVDRCGQPIDATHAATPPDQDCP